MILSQPLKGLGGVKLGLPRLSAAPCRAVVDLSMFWLLFHQTPLAHASSSFLILNHNSIKSYNFHPFQNSPSTDKYTQTLYSSHNKAFICDFLPQAMAGLCNSKYLKAHFPKRSQENNSKIQWPVHCSVTQYCQVSNVGMFWGWIQKLGVIGKRFDQREEFLNKIFREFKKMVLLK